nr:hypothetical protein RVX_2325 [Nitratidesulfovibrio sp. HK-II]
MGGWRAAFGAGACLRSWCGPCPMVRHAADCRASEADGAARAATGRAYVMGQRGYGGQV